MNPDVIRREIDGTKDRIAAELAMLRAREARARELAEIAAVWTVALGCALAAVGAIWNYRHRSGAE